MPKADYLQRSDADFSAQLLTFKNNIGDYATTVGVSSGQVAAQAADALYFAFVLACQQVAQNSAQQWTSWKDLIRDGGTPPPAGMPMAPTFPTSVTAVAPGIQARFRALVAQIKKHANYNPSIGEALGIEGDEQTGPDLSTIKPVIKVKLVGGIVNILWGWDGNGEFLDMLEIEVDRGDGQGWRMLTFDTTPNYNDTAALPATATKWKYRAIYRVGDHRVGQWSDEVSITVAA